MGFWCDMVYMKSSQDIRGDGKQGVLSLKNTTSVHGRPEGWRKSLDLVGLRSKKRKGRKKKSRGEYPRRVQQNGLAGRGARQFNPEHM